MIYVESTLFYWLLIGAMACAVLAVIFAFTSWFFGIASNNGAKRTSQPTDYSKEVAAELKKQTDLMTRNRQEAWSSTDYFKSGFKKDK